MLFALAAYSIVALYGRVVLMGGVAYPHSFNWAFVFVSLLLLIIGALFFLMTHSITRSVSRLTDAIHAFAASGQLSDLPIDRSTPREVRALMSAFVKLATQVEAAHKRDVETSRVKSDFISTAAHQLRTPLTGIRWALEALQKESLTSEQEALVANAAEKSHELVAIVGTLLDISSIESGKYKYAFVKVDMAQFLASEVTEFERLAVDRKVTLRFRPNEHALLSVRIDKERMKWVLDNLLENAIHYTPAGGFVEAWVDMLGQEKLAVYVRDTGIGIPAADRGNIFERFYRAGNAISKESEGNGLGLYIARAIVKDHGGELRFAANAEGIGTTFTLTLPVTA